MAKHRATKRRMKQDTNGHGSRPRFEKKSKGVSDELILAMAEAIGDNNKLPKLALKLGFTLAGANEYVKTNRMHGGVSSEGTRQMLCTWSLRTPAIEQWVKLEAALVDADLAGIADEFSSMAEGKARNVPTFPMEIRSRPVSGSSDPDVYLEEIVGPFSLGRTLIVKKIVGPFSLGRTLIIKTFIRHLESRYTDPARFVGDDVLRNQGFLPGLKRRDSSSAPLYAMENSRHDIFQSPMRRLVVSGGNTAESAALCHGLSYDWATQNRASALSEKQCLFELSANDIKPKQTIENAIKDQLFSDLDDVHEALIRQWLNEMPDEITILLDGADESNCGDNVNIMDVLSGRTHQKVTVMVTTKPRFAKKLHLITPGGYDRIYMQ